MITAATLIVFAMFLTSAFFFLENTPSHSIIYTPSRAKKKQSKPFIASNMNFNVHDIIMSRFRQLYCHRNEEVNFMVFLIKKYIIIVFCDFRSKNIERNVRFFLQLYLPWVLDHKVHTINVFIIINNFVNQDTMYNRSDRK